LESLGDDACFLNIPLGFTFDGFGANTSSVSVSSNGVLFFGQSCSASFSNQALPSNVSPNAALFFFWDDLRDFGGGELFDYTTSGNAPGRVFSMYFRNRLFSSVCGADAFGAMVNVHEGSNLVTVSYQDTTSCPQMRGASATLGLQSAGATSAVLVSFDAPIIDHTASRQAMSFMP
jgi:hypothetical protein